MTPNLAAYNNEFHYLTVSVGQEPDHGLAESSTSGSQEATLKESGKAVVLSEALVGRGLTHRVGLTWVSTLGGRDLGGHLSAIGPNSLSLLTLLLLSGRLSSCSSRYNLLLPPDAA